MEYLQHITELRYALDTFYLLITGVLVMWMAAGFSMLEAGLVRSKNTAEILTKNIMLYGIASILYMFVGYNMMYGNGFNSVFPSLHVLLGPEHSVSDVLSQDSSLNFSAKAGFFFQMVFVATAMSIVSGAIAERMKLWSFLLFAVMMSGFIYPIQGYWSWGGGFLDNLGFTDFAGAGVVHLTGASAALAGVILLGPRKGKYSASGAVNAIPGANMPLATLGTFILWLGWFGFNGGSVLMISNISDANAVANVFVNTNMAAAGGVVAALVVTRVFLGKADLTMALNGALAGLVAITAEPLTPTPGWATLIGMGGGILVVISILSLDKLKIDDPVGAISVHGVVGIWSLLMVSLTNPEARFIHQLLGIITLIIWSFGASFGVWFAIKKLIGIRISQEEEFNGADLAECGLEAYPEFTGSKGSRS